MTTTTPERTPLALNETFQRFLGGFHASFSILNFQMDMLIGKLLKISHLQTHIITAGLMFGPKARMLSDLLRQSDYPKKSDLLHILGRLRAGKREIIAHGHIWSENDLVMFVDRVTSGSFGVKQYAFTLAEFGEHALSFLKDVNAFQQAAGTTYDETMAFAHALDSFVSNASKSGEPPDSIKK